MRNVFKTIRILGFIALGTLAALGPTGCIDERDPHWHGEHRDRDRDRREYGEHPYGWADFGPAMTESMAREDAAITADEAPLGE